MAERATAGRSPKAGLPLVIEPAGSEAESTTAASHAARHWGLDQPQLLRLGMNGVFVAGDVVLRVSRPTAPAASSIALARMLGGVGVRVAAPARDDVVEIDGGIRVTAWERIEPSGAPVAWEEVGAMISRVHTLDLGDVGAIHPLPWCGSFPWWDFDSLLDETLDRAGGRLDDEAARAIRDCVDRHRDWQVAARAGPLVVNHGDVHPHNVIMSAKGPVLIDWDLVCSGPPGWDHASLLTWTERWGGDAHVYERFASGYGLDLSTDPIATALADLRLVSATLMRLRAGATDAAAAAEAQRRLLWWRGDPGAPAWQAM